MRSALRWCDPLRLPLLCKDPLGEIEALLDLAKSPLQLPHLTQSLPQARGLPEGGPHGYLKHAPSPWRAGVLTYQARAPRSVTAFPRAPPEGRPRVMEGSRPYTAVNARRISLATFASPFPLAPSPLPSSTRD